MQIIQGGALLSVRLAQDASEALDALALHGGAGEDDAN